MGDDLARPAGAGARRPRRRRRPMPCAEVRARVHLVMHARQADGARCARSSSSSCGAQDRWAAIVDGLRVAGARRMIGDYAVLLAGARRAARRARRSARPGSATSCARAAWSTGAACASRRTTCRASTSSSRARSIWRSRSFTQGRRRTRRRPSRCRSCSATCTARRDRSAAPSRSTSSCCSGRASRRFEQCAVLLCLGPRLPAGRVRRSRARGVHRGAAARPDEPAGAAEPREAARGSAPVAGGLRRRATR